MFYVRITVTNCNQFDCNVMKSLSKCYTLLEISDKRNQFLLLLLLFAMLQIYFSIFSKFKGKKVRLFLGNWVIFVYEEKWHRKFETKAFEIKELAI